MSFRTDFIKQAGIRDKQYKLIQLVKTGRITRSYDELGIDEKALLVSQEYGEIVSFFIKRMLEVKPNLCLWNLEENLETLKIKKCIFSQLMKAMAIYESYDNKILLKPKHKYSSIYHELMHAASSYIADDGTYMCGFKQSKPLVKKLGVGLNEGYTELLTQRYFYDQGIEYTYNTFLVFAKDIENIIGKDRMEKLYFASDLYTLKEDIIKDMSEEEFMQFLNDLDWLFHTKKERSAEFIKRFQRMGNFVYFTNIKKQKRLLMAGKISKEEYQDKLTKILCNIEKTYFEFDDFFLWKCDREEMIQKLDEIGVYASISIGNNYEKDVYEKLEESQEIKRQAGKNYRLR